MWRNILPLILIGGLGVAAILTALWYDSKRRARERLSAARRKRQANKRTVDDYFEKEFRDLDGK